MKIISLSGGGVRGVWSACILDRLQRSCPHLIESAEIISGTSTGAIIAAGLAIGKSPSEIMDIYLKYLPKIFARPINWKMKTGWGIWGPKYSADTLYKLLVDIFGDKTIDQAQKKLIIPTFDLGSSQKPWKAKFFNSWQDTDKLADCLMASAGSAPIYFPRFSYNHRLYTDGGIACNHPSISALADGCNDYKGKASVDDIRLLSIGSGVCPQHVRPSQWWGTLKWALPALDILQSGQESVVDYQARSILGPHYHRVQAHLERDIKLDDVGDLEYLVELAQNHNIADAQSFLNGFW